jgi:hypothetical protein
MARAAVWHTPCFCFILSCWDLPNQDASCHIWVSLESSHWAQVHWLESVWSYCVEEAIDYWTIFSTKTENCIGILGAFVMLLESPWQVRFNRHYFTIFRAKVWKIYIFLEWILLLEIQTKLQKLGLEGKISWALKCVHTWFNGTGYISTSWI